VLDFTSALYLGLRHPSGSLRPWPQLTTGVPAALAAPPEADAIAQQVATLQGCQRGLLGPSTFHLFWDLFGMLARQPVAIYVDAEAYPIARWGVERAAARGVPVREFAHHDGEALARKLEQDACAKLRPVVLTDGFCPACGKSAPLPAYRAVLRARGGWLIVDDTQALGIFGHTPGPDAPYGRDGGGMLAWFDINEPNVLAVSSLAKGFGAPLAVLSGSRSAVGHFEQNSETRMHCSPPSIAAIRAAEHALTVNRAHGNGLRLRLAAAVRRFRARAAHAGLRFTGGLFPVQTLAPVLGMNPIQVYERLLQRGVQAVLHRARKGRALQLSFLITARHLPQEIDLAVDTLIGALSNRQAIFTASGKRR